ncbi:MAG TPA: CRTAC1 family protein [Planctomycetaceae bacterium]|nr:CRTAC1 family protein [Planctomycetaceae bacterium]
MNDQTDPRNLRSANEGEGEFVPADDAVIGRALRGSMVVAVGLLAIAAGAGLFWSLREKPAPPKQEAVELPEVRAQSELAIPQIPFTDITEQAGIRFVHENGARGKKLLPETMGGGCAFFDFDNDDLPDIFFVNSNRWPEDAAADKGGRSSAATDTPRSALYRNRGDGTFEDVTVLAGLDYVCYGMGVAAGDFDNDGKTDLFISALGRNRLFRNLGGRFVDVTAETGVAGADDSWSTSCGWFDYDRDGDLDLFVCNYVVWSKEHDLAQNFQLLGGARAYGRPQAFEGTYPYLYRNDGGKFTDVAAEAGMHVRNPATNVPLAKSLGVAFCDFDGDGWPDVMVANDTVQNLMFHNQRDGTFEEIGAIAGVAFDVDGQARGAMGIDTAWFRNNDDIGIAIGNFSTEMTALYVSSDGSLQFTDEAVSTGVGPSSRLELKFSVFFFDADLDGRLDLFAANGHLEDEINKVQPSQRYEQPPHLFWNAGASQATEFVPLTEAQCGPAFFRPLVGRGAAFADIDGDGDLDVLITAVGGRPRLLRNDQQTGHHWLRFRLKGRTSNADAVGARIEVRSRGQLLRQQVAPTRGYLAQSEATVTFGLGEQDKADEVRIVWPSGRQSKLTDVATNRVHIVEEPAAEDP